MASLMVMVVHLRSVSRVVVKSGARRLFSKLISYFNCLPHPFTVPYPHETNFRLLGQSFNDIYPVIFEQIEVIPFHGNNLVKSQKSSSKGNFFRFEIQFHFRGSREKASP